MGILHRKNVALLVESSRAYGRHVLNGIARYSRTVGNWSLLHGEMTIDASVPDWLLQTEVDGVIARVDDQNVAELRALGVPIIDVRCSKVFQDIPQIETDDREVARLAFEHLWQLGFRRFAFSGYRGAHFSESRGKHFADFVRERGHTIEIHEINAPGWASLTEIERGGVKELDSFSQWLKSLRRPTGMLVCNDIRGQQVLISCRRLGLLIPDDLAVVGVDDDDSVCQLCDPPLSSVKPNADKVGFRAAQLLQQLMDHGSVKQKLEYIPPTCVVQRLSTQVFAINDPEVSRACRFIRENISRRINVADVVNSSSLSRRQLERRFRDELGHTPHDEITAAQVYRVKQLLSETDLTLENIAPLAGYSHKERLAAVFKRECGETPGSYRERVSNVNSI